MAEAGKANAAYEQASPFWRLAALRARKYNIPRALEVLGSYLEWRKEYKIDEVTFDSTPQLLEVLDQEAVYSAGNRDRGGRYIITIRLARTNPGQHPVSHAIRVTHANVEYILRRFPDAQARGICVVNDMRGASFSNLDSRIPRTIIKAFSKTIPVRFGGAYLFHPLMIMRIIFPLVKP
jgi:hypothetical protein